jgi:hypothetical protein
MRGLSMLESLRNYVSAKRGSAGRFWRVLFPVFDRLIILSPRGLRNAARSRRINANRDNKDELNNRLRRAFLPVLTTPPQPCNPHASVELHTLTSHDHLPMYLLALKSLLRFHSDVAVVAHDGDGDFTEADRRILAEHIPGLRIIDRAEADRSLDSLLAPYPLIIKYRRRIANSLELIDNLLLARTDRVATMNSDVLFLHRPNEFIEWLGDRRPQIRFIYEENPYSQREFLQEIGSSFPPHVTLALTCCFNDIVDLPFIEDCLRTSRVLKSHQWQAGQDLFPALFERCADRYSALPFEPSRADASGTFRDGAIFRHYWASGGTFIDRHIEDAERVIAVLSE